MDTSWVNFYMHNRVKAAIDALVQLEDCPREMHVKDFDKDGSWLVLRISADVNESIKVLKMPVYTGLFVRALVLINYIEDIRKRFKSDEIYGDFCFGLHDLYEEDLNGLFVFSKYYDKKGILIPDYCALCEYCDGLDSISIDIEYASKLNCGLFVGEHAGYDRERFCRDVAFSENVKGILERENISLSKEEQLQYKVLISIDGATACWDRLPWILNSSSILFKQKSKKVCWYYPLLVKGVHYIEFDMNDSDWLATLEKQICHIIGNDSMRRSIVRNANIFTRTYLTHDSHMYYFNNVLKAYRGRTFIV